MLPSERLADWRVRLEAFCAATAAAPFRSGHQDCALWALRAADVVCGTQFASAFAGHYADDDGAIDLAAARGWRSGFEACRAFCGEPLVRVGLATDGDVCFRPLPPWRFGVTMVRIGQELWGPGTTGLARIPFRAALCGARWTAFPVGRVP